MPAIPLTGLASVSSVSMRSAASVKGVVFVAPCTCLGSVKQAYLILQPFLYSLRFLRQPRLPLQGLIFKPAAHIPAVAAGGATHARVSCSAGVHQAAFAGQSQDCDLKGSKNTIVISYFLKG